MPCSWEGNRRSGVALAMRHRLQWFIHLWAHGPEWWGAGVVICLERGADLHMAQLMPLPLTVSCSSKIQIGFTLLVPAHLGSPGQMAVKRARVCVCVCVWAHGLKKN